MTKHLYRIAVSLCNLMKVVVVLQISPTGPVCVFKLVVLTHHPFFEIGSLLIYNLDNGEMNAGCDYLNCQNPCPAKLAGEYLATHFVIENSERKKNPGTVGTATMLWVTV